MSRALVGQRSMAAAAALVVAVLGGASVAWACSVQPHIAAASSSAGQTSGPVGTRVTVTGRDFGPGPVQVRWNSRSGQVLGEGQGPSFSVPITIPEASAGVHYIVAVQTVGTAMASLAFEVTAPARTTGGTSGSNTSGTTSTSAGGADEETAPKHAGASQSDNTTNSKTEPNTAASPAGSSAAANTSGASGSHAVETRPAQAAAGAEATWTASSAVPSSRTSAASASARTVSPAPAGQSGAASANPAAVTTPGGQVVFGGSSTSTGASAEPEEHPSNATVSGDTWSGFEAGGKPSLLAAGLDGPASPGGTSAGLGLGLSLVGSGVVALFAGFAVAESSRKRALATGSQGRRH